MDYRAQFIRIVGQRAEIVYQFKNGSRTSLLLDQKELKRLQEGFGKLAERFLMGGIEEISSYSPTKRDIKQFGFARRALARHQLSQIFIYPARNGKKPGAMTRQQIVADFRTQPCLGLVN